MTLAELIAHMADRSGLTKTQVRAAIGAFVDVTAEVLEAHDRVRLPGLGTFDVSWRKPRQIRDVRTARKMDIEGVWVPRFRPASSLKRQLKDAGPVRLSEDHAAARQVACTIASDLLLYGGSAPNGVRADTEVSEVRARCATHFGSMWADAVQAYEQRVAKDIRASQDHLALAARAIFAAA